MDRASEIAGHLLLGMLLGGALILFSWGLTLVVFWSLLAVFVLGRAFAEAREVVRLRRAEKV